MPGTKRGVAIWIASFLTFMAGLNSIHAIILWSKGDLTVTPYLIGQIIGEIPIMIYFWLSVTLTFVFLGLTSIVAYRTPPIEKTLLHTSTKLEENISRFRKDILAFLKNLSEERGEQTLAVEEVNKTTKALKKNFSERLEGNRKAREEILEKVGTTLSSAKEEMLRTIETQEESIRKIVERTGEQSARTLESHAKELAEIRTRVEKMEAKLTPEPPKLTSKNSVEEIKGIGPRIANELKILGINNVMDLVTADPIVVMKKTGSISSEKVAQWQAIAQLQMIPGINEDDADLLEKAGIRSRRELADQDPISLSKKIGVSKNQDAYGKVPKGEKPAIEEIASWIRQAKL